MEAGATIAFKFMKNQRCLRNSGLIKKILTLEEKGKKEEEGYVEEKEEFFRDS